MKFIKVWINILLLMLLSVSGISQEIQGGIGPDALPESGQDISSETETGQDVSAETNQDIPPKSDKDIQPESGKDVSQILFITELDGKRTAVYGDALRMFGFQARETSGSKGYMLTGYSDDSPLTKGMVSLMAARHLNLKKKSLMYRIFGSERYAYRLCWANKLFNELRSENDPMSGTDLIEMFIKIDELKTTDNKDNG